MFRDSHQQYGQYCLRFLVQMWYGVSQLDLKILLVSISTFALLGAVIVIWQTLVW